MISGNSPAQILEVNFNQYITFSNPDLSTDFFTIYKEDSIIVEEVAFGVNKYVVDLKKRNVKFYRQERLEKTRKITEVKEKDGLILLTVEDKALESNDPILVYFAINPKYEENNYPYFTFYYHSAGKTHGYIAFIEEQL